MRNQEEKRELLYSLLGELPTRPLPVSAEILSSEDNGGYILEKLVLDLNGIEQVPAFFVKPLDFSGRVPVVLFNHSHGGQYGGGKRELIEPASYMHTPSYAEQLASMGYCALCIDTWNFGERRGRSESELFKEMLWNGRVLWGMMAYDSIKALDYLVTRPEVDPERIATLGMSMGSTMAWWTAALDTRIKVCVDICCLTDFEALIKLRNLDGHGLYYYVPALLKHFTTGEINSLIAPRPHLSVNGNFDKLTPPDGLDRIDRMLRQVYSEAGAPEAWQLLRYDVGHVETAHMRGEIVKFLEKWL